VISKSSFELGCPGRTAPDKPDQYLRLQLGTGASHAIIMLSDASAQLPNTPERVRLHFSTTPLSCSPATVGYEYYEDRMAAFSAALHELVRADTYDEGAFPLSSRQEVGRHGSCGCPSGREVALPLGQAWPSVRCRKSGAGVRTADSGPSRTVIPAHCGQQSGDCGQFLMSV
jgi:hypothetical protein